MYIKNNHNSTLHFGTIKPFKKSNYDKPKSIRFLKLN